MKERRNVLRKILASALSAAMIGTMIPTAAFAAGSQPAKPLLADFTFDDEASTLKGGNAKAAVQGSYELRDSKDAANGKALYLNGNAANYLKITDSEGGSLLAGKEEITISYDAKPDQTGTSWVFYAAPNEKGQASPEYYIGAFAKDGNTKVERYLNGRTLSFTAPTGTDWSHVDIVYGKTTTTIYVNGAKKQSVENNKAPLTGILGNNGIFYIGRANWGSGEGYKGWIDNFKVYDGALTEGDLVDVDATIQADKAALTLPSEVVEDFELPSVGANGSTLTWDVSENENVTIGEDGYQVTVTRPSGQDVTVTFTATIEYYGEQDTKEIPVKVIKEKTDADVAKEAAEKLDIATKEDVRGNVTLPTEIEVPYTETKATVSWSSSNPAVVTDKDAGEKAAGVVTRPASDTDVTMTATVSCGSAKETKAIVLKVKAAPKNLDTDYTAGYLWTNFDAAGGYEKIFFGYSEDGLKWEKLNKDAGGTAQPVLVNDAEGSDLGVRDPHIIRSAEGDKYWILGTDLHAEGGGPGGSGWDQVNASQNIVVWESDDLVNWSEPRLVYAGFDNAGCVWAPEAIYDETTGDYLVYWSARDKSKVDTNENALRVYVCRTRDFINFTEAKEWLSEDGPDNGYNIIDSTIVKEGDTFYRFSTSDWFTVIDYSDTLSEDLFDVNQNAATSVNGDWTRLVTRSGSSAAGFDGREGFTVYQLPDGRWCAMGDNQGYQAFVTDDLSKGKFTKATAIFADGRFRHGTVMRLSETEQANLLKAFGEDQTVDPGPVEPVTKKVLAQFDFDDEQTGLVSENAKAAGKYTLTDSYAAEAGKALYLNGNSDNFLSVTDKNGGSLLTGATELTVSFEAKPENTSTNWPLYAAPNTSSPDYNKSEHYIGFLMKDGSLTVERYNQNGNRPTNPSAAIGNDWVRVDVAMTASKTSIYINGVLQSEVASAHKIEDILKNASILQIGKANWNSGEFYRGWIDNMTIRSYAMTAQEIKEAAAPFVDLLPAVSGAVIGSAPTREEAADYRGTDYHTAIYTELDDNNKTLTPYVRKHADVTKLPVTVNLNTEAELMADGKAFTNGSVLDLSEDVELTVKKAEGKDEVWTIKAAEVVNNPVLPGQYADPDIDYFDGKFWIFPTTDGYPGWSGTLFHAFSSEDMVNWEDEGVIMDLANDNPGVNEKGVQIASSPWATKNAWAPTIEEKDGKYYFYYCGNNSANGQQAIGVAVADNPAGPYVDKGEPLITNAMCSAAGVRMGQSIDPSIFTDDDGRSYIMFGNGSAAMAELGDDMTSIKEGTFKQLNGLRDFRESPVVLKVGDTYHWTWSCDDTGSPNYHVNYGVSDSLDGNVTYVKTLLQKDESKNMLGTAHQSMMKITDVYGQERIFIAYHRFYTPLNIYTSGLGYHRETCIDEVTIGDDGYMQATPTLEGVGEVRVSLDKEDLQNEVDQALTDADGYTEGSWKKYQDALNAAKDVLKNEKATQEQIDKALQELLDAKGNLLEKLPFVDVAEDDWFYNEVYYNNDKGYMTGKDETHFAPYENLARAQFAVILHRIDGEPEGKNDKTFPDVASGEWYTDAVLWAASSDVEIIKGYTNTGLFGTADNITREQMAVMMYRYAEYKGYAVDGKTSFDKFEDADKVSAFANEAMQWAVGNGIITGKDNGTRLDPQGNTSRAECAIIIQRFMEKYTK